VSFTYNIITDILEGPLHSGYLTDEIQDRYGDLALQLAEQQSAELQELSNKIPDCIEHVLALQEIMALEATWSGYDLVDSDNLGSLPAPAHQVRAWVQAGRDAEEAEESVTTMSDTGLRDSDEETEEGEDDGMSTSC
jgi:hypothetical protein